MGPSTEQSYVRYQGNQWPFFSDQARRVVFMLDHEHAPVSSEVNALLSDAVDALARASATVVEGWPAGVDSVQDYESFAFHVLSLFAFQQPGEDFATLSEFIDHESRRMAARVAWTRYFDETRPLEGVTEALRTNPRGSERMLGVYSPFALILMCELVSLHPLPQGHHHVFVGIRCRRISFRTSPRNVCRNA